MSDDNFISRWSRRKHQARQGVEPAEPAPPSSAPAPGPVGPAVAMEAAEAPVETPPLESLTPESDFAPFMNPKVDPGLRRQALKTLFADPRYNVMDGLDVYIDDYSKPDPLPEGWLEKMNQVARLGDYQPPKPEEAEEAQAVAPEAAPPELAPPEPAPDPDVLAASEVPPKGEP